jgi:hypothetical protein
MWDSHHSSDSFFIYSLFLSFRLLPGFTDCVMLAPECRLRCNTIHSFRERFGEPNLKARSRTPWGPHHMVCGPLGCVFYRVRRVAIVSLCHRRKMRFVSDLECGHSLTVQYRPLGAHMPQLTAAIASVHCPYLGLFSAYWEDNWSTR